MKYLVSLLVMSLCTGCATHKTSAPKDSTASSGTRVSARQMPSVRTPEIVKAYPVGRYTDPNYPDEMHERHTIYRREQSPKWNYLPDRPYALPMGPEVATSNPSPSWYAKAESEVSSRQRAYAEALQEQNRAMKKRIEALQQEAGNVPDLEQEIDRLKRQTDEKRETPALPVEAEPARQIEDDLFSTVEPELPTWEQGVSDPGEIVLFAETNEQSQEFLISQMRLNDEFAADLAAAERRRISSVLYGPFLRRKELAFFTQ